MAPLFGQRQQGVDGQDAHAQAKRQALRHRTRGAQARERTRPTAHGDHTDIVQRQVRLRQHLVHGGQQTGRGLGPTRALVRPHQTACRYGHRQLFGAGLDGQALHGALAGAGLAAHTPAKMPKVTHTKPPTKCAFRGSPKISTAHMAEVDGTTEVIMLVRTGP